VRQVSGTSAKRLVARIPGVVPAYEGWHRHRAERAAVARRRDDETELRRLGAGTDLRINIGSSDNALDGWINVDIRPGDHSFVMDATRPWPFRDNSAAAVNSEHFIEHLTVEEAREYLGEAYRVLQPGGVIRTSTPDLEGLCRGFLARDPAALEVHRSHGYEAATHGDMVNNYVYMWDHRHIWDLESLGAALEDTGFAGVERAPFGRSRHAVLDGIDRHDPEALADLVLTVDAVKPGS
jgi:predicted SAM-dependent methyltransferase